MTFLGWAKKLTRSRRRRIASLVSVGTMFSVTPAGLALTFVAENGERAMIQIEPGEWREWVERVDRHLARSDRHQAQPCPERCDGGPHEFTPDIEYDQTGQTINCEHCGEEQPT